MARLARFTQLIFGSNAGTGQMAEFGSLAAAAPQTYSGTTITPSIVQTLSNYLTGWFGAVIGSNSPAEEDMNALFYLITFQLAYLMQAGVAEWDAATTYYIGSLAQDGIGNVYISQQNTNLNNALSNASFWSPQQSGLPSFVVTTLAQLTTALASCAGAGGGLIAVTAGFSISTALTVPAGTIVQGRYGGTILTFIAGGSLTLGDGAIITNLYFASALNDGSSLIKFSNQYASVKECNFAVTAGNSVICINMTGSANRVTSSIFSGVAGQANSIAIQYTSGIDNSDSNSVFLP